LLFPVAIIGAWTLVAMAAAVQAAALTQLDGRTNLVDAILGRVAILPLWALATPFILRSARRLPVAGSGHRVSPAALIAHFALGTLFVVLTNVAIRIPIAFAPMTAGGGLEAMVRSTMQGVAEYYPPAMVVYGVIVAIGHFIFRPPTSADSSETRPPSPSPSAQMVVESASDSTARADAVPNGHITVRQWNRVHLVRVDDIDFVEAEDNYVVVHAASRSYKGRDRISDVESQLDARRFVRIHRSTIVALAKIREVQPLTHGDHAVILRDGRVLRVARSRRQALGEALGLEL
jgi:hypothetical protein